MSDERRWQRGGRGASEPFSSDELIEAGERPWGSEIEEATTTGRRVQAAGQIAARPSADFVDRVMVAVAREPLPAPAVAAGEAMRRVRIAGLLAAVGDGWRVLVGTGHPFAARAQALALVVVALVVVGSASSLAVVGAANVLRGPDGPVVTPAPSVGPTTSPSLEPTPSTGPTPSASPSPSASPTPSPAPTPSASPTQSPTARPTATPTRTPDDTPEPTRTLRPAETLEPGETLKPGETLRPAETPEADDNSGSDNSGSGNSGSDSGSGNSGNSGSGSNNSGSGSGGGSSGDN